MTIEGPRNAFHGAIFGTQASQEEVSAFYDDELTRLGWQRDTYQVFASTGELEAWGWCKPRMRFRLAIKKPGNFEESFYQGKTFATVFDARLIGRDPDVACPVSYGAP